MSNISDSIIHSQRLRETFLSDDCRPGYHFAIPGDNGLPGDPNGAFYAGGRYHLMYLYHCIGDGFRYGHISSIDLLHWRRHGDALKVRVFLDKAVVEVFANDRQAIARRVYIKRKKLCMDKSVKIKAWEIMPTNMF